MGLGRFYAGGILFCALLLFCTVGCKKKKAFNEENGQAAEDARRTQEQNDEVTNDINVAIMEQPLLRGGTSSQPFKETELCGVNIDSAGIYQGILQLNYNGTLCNGLKKTGIIKVKFLDYPTKKWKNETCQIMIEFIGYKVVQTNGVHTNGLWSSVFGCRVQSKIRNPKSKIKKAARLENLTAMPSSIHQVFKFL
jgi:hypothetical protein